MLLIHEQKYPPSATTLHFEFYAEPGPDVKVERKVKVKTFKKSYSVTAYTYYRMFILTTEFFPNLF